VGYKVDPLLSALAARHWEGRRAYKGLVLAYLLHAPPDPAGNYTQSLYLEEVHKEVQERGFLLNVLDLRDHTGPQMVQRVMGSRGVRGVLVPPFPHQGEDAALQLDYSRLSVLAIGTGRRAVPFHAVVHDAFRAMREVFLQVWNRGYRRIALAPFAHRPLAQDDAWRLGAACFFRMMQGTRALPLFCGTHDDRAGFLRWVKKVRPDAVITFSGTPYWWLHEAGYRMPQDLGFAALNTGSAVDLSGTWADHRQLVRVALDQLVHLIRKHEMGISAERQVLYIQQPWREGHTLRPKGTECGEFPSDLGASIYPWE
jgi:DNA-binding LacI/PurR family transcriptional regulator